MRAFHCGWCGRNSAPVLAGGALAALLLAVAGCGSGGGGVTAPPPPSTDWQRVVENPLLIPPTSPAPSTTFEVSIADPSVMYDAVDGRWKAWYSATVFDTAIANDPGRIVIKYADSPDGVHWTTQAAPVISSRGAATDWDYTHVETPSVIRNPDPAAPAGRRFMLFYAGGNTVADGAAGRPLRSGYPYYQIGLAWSADGRSFTRDQPGVGGRPGLLLTAASVLASVPGYADGLVADPEAVVRNGEILLWCSSYAENPARSPLAFGISHARSTTGAAWTFPAANPLASIYKAGALAGGEQPAVIYDPGQARFTMWFKNDAASETALLPTVWFTASGFWRATSTDGVSWLPDYSQRDFLWDGSRDYETYGLLTGCAVVRHEGVDHLFFGAWGTHGIPDPLRYQVPLQSGATVPAVITFNQAVRPVPIAAPAGAAWRPHGLFVGLAQPVGRCTR